MTHRHIISIALQSFIVIAFLASHCEASGIKDSTSSKADTVHFKVSPAFKYRISGEDSTTVDSTESQPLEYQMNISARNEIYNSSGIDDRRPKRTTLLDIVGSATNNEINVSWDAHLSTEDLTSSQAVDNISIFAEYYKLGKLTVGDIVPKYSEFGLNGITVRGLDAQVKSGIFNLQMTAGINQRASEGDSSFFIDGTYMRYLAASKLSIGNEKGFITRLSITKVKDKNESITVPGATKPQESLIATLNYSAYFFDDKLRWTGEANISDHTRNTGSEEYKDQLRIFGEPIFKTRLSSRVSEAYYSTLDLTLPDAVFSGKYKRVQPGYTSLGTIRTDNDYEEMSMDGRYSLFHRFVSARSLILYRHDNLDDSKIATAQLVKFLQTGYFHLDKNISFSLSYSLFLDKDNYGKDTISYARNGLTQAITFSPMVIFGTSEFFNRLYGLISLNILKNGEGADTRSNYENYNFMLSYGCNIGNNFSMALSNSHVRMLQPVTRLDINTTELTFDPSFFQQKLKMKIRTAFSYTTGKLVPDRHWESGCGFDIRLTAKEVLSIQLRQTWHNPNRDGGFSEFRWWLNYIHEIF